MKSDDVLAKTVVDESQFRKKYLLKLLASPFSLFPFLAGVTDLLALWTFSLRSGPALFAGIAGILVGLGFFFTRLVMGDKDSAKEVIQTVQKQALAEREKRLDDLDRRLSSADSDPRPENCLRDLRALAKAFEDGKSWDNALSGRPTIDILSGVDKLFQECVVYLEKTLDLGYAADEMATEAARKPILKQRERIIADVSKSIQQLGKVLTGIQTLEAKEQGSQDSDLAVVRRELDQSLEVARKVKERMSSLDMDFENKV
jgi:hypothetical protein